MDSLFSILSSKDFDEPPEIASVKKFIFDEFKVEADVQLRNNDLIVTVPGAALVNTLRLRGPELKRRCQLQNRKLLFRMS